MNYKLSSQGWLLIFILVFGSIFFVILTALLGFVLTQFRAQEHELNNQRAFAVAESGINYYKWYLAHNPGDYTHGTGSTSSFDIAIEDPVSGQVGTSTLTISGDQYCGQTGQIMITSEGYTAEAPDIKRTVVATYSRPTIANYSFIANSNIGFGPTETISGPVHSNGRIAMYASHDAIVSSSRNSGVVGDGPDSHLWRFPVQEIDFTAIAGDLSVIKNHAVNNGGLYFAPSGKYGYYLTFNDNDSVTVETVDTIQPRPSGVSWDYNMPIDKTTIGTYDIPATCPVIFVEDTAWIEGDISGKIGLGVGDLINPGVSRDIILQGNLINVPTEPDAGLLALAQRSMVLGFMIPDDMLIEGVFIAQSGSYGRPRYINNYRIPAAWRMYVLRNRLVYNGTVASNAATIFPAYSSGGSVYSGFLYQDSLYNRSFSVEPPPFTPYISDNYFLRDWRQED